MPRSNLLRNFRFRLKIDGIAQAIFSEVAIGETTAEAVDYWQGNDLMHVGKLSGVTKSGNITFKRGVTDSLEILNWHKQIVAGQIQSNSKQASIVAIDEAGAEKARFVVAKAWPLKYDPSDLNGEGNEVLIELLELIHEGIERVK